MNCLKRINEQIKNNYLYFISSFLLFFCIYSLVFNPSYTSDHLGNSVVFPTKIGTYIKGGRATGFFFELLYYVLNHFHISKWENSWVLQLITLIILANSVTIIMMQYRQLLRNKNLLVSTIVLCLAFANPFFVETFVYIGFELSVAILAIAFAMNLYIKKKYILSWILLFFSICTYQSYYVIFVLLTAMYYYLENDLLCNIKIIKKEIILVLFSVSTCLTNIIITRIYALTNNTSEVKQIISPLSKSNVFEDLYDSIKGTFFYLNGFYHPGILWYVFIVLFIFGLIIMINKKNISKIFLYIVVNSILLISPYMIGIVMEQSFFPPRIIWPIFLSVSLQILMVYFMMPKHIEKIFLFVGCIFFLYNIFQTQTSILELYQSNTLDIEYVRMVQKNIEKYENESGIQVTKVATFRNDNSESCYKDYTFHRYRGYSYTRKMVSVDWGDVDLLNEMNWEKYQKITFDNSTLLDKMANYDSHVFDAEEQLFFEGDTLYWYIY